MIEWRQGTQADSTAVTEIFNHFIAHSWAAYGETPVTEAWSEKFIDSARRFYILENSGHVLGFATLNPFREQATFNHCATLTYFLLPEAAGQGQGTQVLQRIEDDALRMGITQLLAHISSKNLPSLRFHEQRGFVECGRFRRAGRKWNISFDLVWMQKSLDSSPDAP